MNDAKKENDENDEVSQESLIDRVSSAEFWLRLVYMLLFFMIISVATYLMIFVVIAQFFWYLFAGEKNSKILVFSKQLSFFMYEILLFLSQNSDDKPFPFKDWPE